MPGRSPDSGARIASDASMQRVCVASDARRKVEGLAIEFIAQVDIDAVGDFKPDRRAARAPEELHGVVTPTARVLCDADADVHDRREQHVAAVLRRLFPAVQQARGQLLGRESDRIEQISDVLGNHAVAVTRCAGTLGRSTPVDLVTEAILHRQDIGEILRRVTQSRLDRHRQKSVPSAEGVGQIDHPNGDCRQVRTDRLRRRRGR